MPQNTVHKTDSRFDFLKGIMALFIIILHTKLFPDTFIPIVRIAVPVFFIMSAYFFFRKIYAANNTDKNKSIIKFVKRSLLLYLFWFIILFPATYISRKHFGESLSPFGLLYSALLNSTFPASWFIMACVICTSIVYIFRKHLMIVTVISLVLYLMCCAESSYFYLFKDYNLWFESIFKSYSICNSFPAGLFWICVGAWCARCKINGGIKFWLYTSIISILLLFTEYYICVSNQWLMYTDCFISLIFAAPSLFILVSKLPHTSYSWTLPLRHSTVIAYCLHGSIAFGLFPIMKHYDIQQPVMGVAVFSITMVLVVIGSLAIINLSKKKGFGILKYAY